METFSHHPFVLYPLTAIHIGGGMVLEPHQYIVRGNEVHRFAERKLFAKLQNAGIMERYAELSASDIAEAVALVEPHVTDDVIAERIPCEPGFEEYWRARLSTSLETLELTLFPRTIDGYYLPGSSLKGAIRTAFYSVLGFQKNYPPEWEAFGHARYPLDSSPFKRLKVSDVDLGRNVEVGAIYGLKIETWTTGAPDVIRLLLRGNLEAIPDASIPDGYFENLDALPVKFTGSFTVVDGYPGQEVVSMSALMAHTREFSKAQIEYEISRPNIGPFYEALYASLRPAMSRLDTTLVRVGYGGGRLATSVLVYSPEVIAEELAKAKFALSRDPHPKTRKIAGRHPMGWALLRVLK